MNINYADLSPEDLIRCKAYAVHALSTEQGVHQTFLLAQALIQAKVPGCFVECGVAAGAQVAAMSWACQKHGDPRQIHLFDSFQGIPLAGPEDHDQPGLGDFIADRGLPVEHRLKPSGVSECSLELVVSLLKTWGFGLDRYVFHPGWFQETMPNISIPPIAFLRMDGDLYESTECCLKWLYPYLMPGGIAFLDDYPLPGSRRAFEHYFIRRNLPIPQVIENVNTGAAYWVK
jgi:hypothetical protein